MVVSYSVGDGAMVTYTPETYSLQTLTENDSGENAGETRFLSKEEISSDALDRRVKYHFFPALPLILLMTDGVSDPKFNSQDELNLGSKWLGLYHELEPVIHAANQGEKLLGWLDSYIKQHHDDRTLVIFNPNDFADRIGDVEQVKQCVEYAEKTQAQQRKALEEQERVFSQQSSIISSINNWLDGSNIFNNGVVDKGILSVIKAISNLFTNSSNIKEYIEKKNLTPGEITPFIKLIEEAKRKYTPTPEVNTAANTEAKTKSQAESPKPQTEQPSLDQRVNYQDSGRADSPVEPKPEVTTTSTVSTVLTGTNTSDVTTSHTVTNNLEVTTASAVTTTPTVATIPTVATTPTVTNNTAVKTTPTASNTPTVTTASTTSNTPVAATTTMGTIPNSSTPTTSTVNNSCKANTEVNKDSFSSSVTSENPNHQPTPNVTPESALSDVTQPETTQNVDVDSKNLANVHVNTQGFGSQQNPVGQMETEQTIVTPASYTKLTSGSNSPVNVVSQTDVVSAVSPDATPKANLATSLTVESVNGFDATLANKAGLGEQGNNLIFEPTAQENESRANETIINTNSDTNPNPNGITQTFSGSSMLDSELQSIKLNAQEQDVTNITPANTAEDTYEDTAEDTSNTATQAISESTPSDNGSNSLEITSPYSPESNREKNPLVEDLEDNENELSSKKSNSISIAEAMMSNVYELGQKLGDVQTKSSDSEQKKDKNDVS